MADNTVINAGSGGPTISADDVGAGLLVQRVKVQYGADGSATDVAAATPLPVDPTKQQTLSGTLTANGQSLTMTGLTGGSVTVFVNGTYGSMSITFEMSPDGTNWFPINVQSLGSSGSTYASFISSDTSLLNGVRSYLLPVNGASQVRVRSTAYTSGTMNVWMVANAFSPPNAHTVVDLNQGITQAVTATISGTVGLTAPNATFSILDVSSARTASGTGNINSAAPGGNIQGIMFWIAVTAVSGTSPTLTVRPQWSPDGSSTWIDWDTTNLQTPSITATGNYFLRVGLGLPTVANASLNDLPYPQFRYAWTIGGTTPSFTFVNRYWFAR